MGRTTAALRVESVTVSEKKADYRLLGAALLKRIQELDKDPAIEAEYQEWLKEREKSGTEGQYANH